ncbi:hypothetical protein G7K_6770-t1 [Saitoella complicata NRRL Y-17804]|uniref:Uncharacterized protein n=1 Tax=Saitoella complicata (strain BCRC 22490 / CBS 7301 / JCM 7358 / NBRC 10748 / NRRL Y-17804) TaxID=698492 RepID=A0A0E9NS68_SAICN|nr:hypothetical protein G7K_6770-t1 [Saitoella complicata NRRL Y-17804]
MSKTRRVSPVDKEHMMKEVDRNSQLSYGMRRLTASLTYYLLTHLNSTKAKLKPKPNQVHEIANAPFQYIVHSP